MDLRRGRSAGIPSIGPAGLVSTRPGWSFDLATSRVTGITLRAFAS
jgi:hypothetical protein